MSYSDENLTKIAGEYQTTHGKYDRLLEAYLTWEFREPKAREHAVHGFVRRLKLMVRAIDKVFELFPPERTKLPTTDERCDAEIYIQAFLINLFGALDNLAWIWVHEKNLVGADGTLFPRNQVGLGVKNKQVRHSFSPEFQNYLRSIDEWFEGMTDYRDSLAHRIPLYIPPFVVQKSNQAAYDAFEERIAEALDCGDLIEHARLSAEQLRLAEFRPWITHSFVERARPVVFHPQLLANFNTIEELGRKILEELGSSDASPAAA